MNITQICQAARNASFQLAAASTATKNELLLFLRDHLKANQARIAEANAQDVATARELVEKGELSKPLLSRLILTEDKIQQLFTYLEEVAKLADPVGKKQYAMRLDQGLDLERVSCPIGVIAVIFESRPEVVIQVSALGLKSGNAVILKGGAEALQSNRVLFELLDEGLQKFQGGKLRGGVNLIETREDVKALLDQDAYVDLIIPRGSNSFVRYIQDHTKIPVLGHAAGICHLYLAQDADPAMAVKLALDAKLDYPSACNAVETILVHRSQAALAEQVRQALVAKGVEVRFENATEEDWATEYSDLIVSLKLVESDEEAIAHINRYGSHHTDSIVTQSKERAAHFMDYVDSACVFHNASTRFSDGYVFGLGAEVGISTNKTHSRGPVGLDGLVIYKYKLKGSGQVRGDYGGSQPKARYLHQPLPLKEQ